MYHGRVTVKWNQNKQVSKKPQNTLIESNIISNEKLKKNEPENAAKVLFLRENLPRVNYDY